MSLSRAETLFVCISLGIKSKKKCFEWQTDYTGDVEMVSDKNIRWLPSVFILEFERHHSSYSHTLIKGVCQKTKIIEWSLQPFQIQTVPITCSPTQFTKPPTQNGL